MTDYCPTCGAYWTCDCAPAAVEPSLTTVPVIWADAVCFSPPAQPSWTGNPTAQPTWCQVALDHLCATLADWRHLPVLAAWVDSQADNVEEPHPLAPRLQTLVGRAAEHESAEEYGRSLLTLALDELVKESA